MIVNNSKDNDNWTQLKNQKEPLSTCNVTACINGAQAAGYDVMALRKGLAERPADDLYLFIRANAECIALWNSLDPKHEIPINQWIAVLALGLSLWIGNRNAATFKMTSFEPMRDCIIKGGACIVSGHYPTTKGYIDHITALVGVDYDDDTYGVSNWIMDDSYGDYRTRYEVKVGDNIVMPHSDFQMYVKEVMSTQKRCIFIPKKGNV